MSLIKVNVPTKDSANRLNAVANNAMDANFKVGDLVRMSEGGLTGKITKIEPNGHFRVSFLYNKANGFSQSFSSNEIVMVKPAAKDSDEFKVGVMVRFKNGEYKGKVFRLQEFQGGYARLVSPIGGVQIPKHLLKDEVTVVNDSATMDGLEDNLKKHIGTNVRVFLKNGHDWIGKITKVDRGVLTLHTGVRVVISDIKQIFNNELNKALDAWNVNDSKLIDEISKESIRALDAFSAYLAKQERLVVNTKAALAKAKQGGNLAEIKWLADALGEFENELRKARALV